MKKFEFTNRDGHKLSGRLELPDGSPRSYAIFAHCFTCSKNVKAATQVSRRLAELGIAVLRFDFTGLGNSEGDFANSDFSSNVDDLVDAAAALKERMTSPSLLIGHSLGGAAVLMAAARIESVRAIATIGAPSEPEHVENLINITKTQENEDGSATINLGGRELVISSRFVEDLKNNQMSEILPKLGKPIMIFHSPIDAVVSIDNARKLYELAKHPKSFVSLDGADHMLNEPGDAAFVANTLSAWASRYLLTELDSNESDSQSKMPAKVDEGVVIVREQNGSLTQMIRTENHEFYADEPARVGGADLGPNPYEFLLVALGACTSMTLRMYARHKGLQLDSIEIRLQHSRIHAEDCESCETRKGMIDRIDKTILVGGDLTADQVKRLGEIADRCPVHRTITNEKQIETNIQLVSG